MFEMIKKERKMIKETVLILLKHLTHRHSHTNTHKRTHTSGSDSL